MQARIKNPVSLLPDVLPGLLAAAKGAEPDGLPLVTRKLVHLRASQINGCSVCVDMHSRELQQAGQSNERLFAVAAWRHTPYFTEAERAALALTECLTRICDAGDPVPDEIWEQVMGHYDEAAAAALIVHIGIINLFNRLALGVRQQVGAGLK